jgi:type IV pilus assembly protein PilQ
LIERVDHPRYQIHLKAILYSVDEKRLRRSGSRYSAIMGNANQTNFLQAVGTSAASESNAILGILNFDDTATFLEQLARAQRHDVVRVLARPFGVVFDDDTISFDAGIQVPIALPSESDKLRFVMASRILRINPQVGESFDGKIDFVTLNIQVENNVVDKSSGKYKGLPGIDRQSIQTILRLRDGQTAVFGGLTDPTDKVLSRTPFLSSIPGLGDLFKHRKNETLYCALTIQVLP